MKFKITVTILEKILFLLFALTIFASIFGKTIFLFCLSLIIFILITILIKKKIGWWNNITIIFLIFWGLYIFVGPYANITQGVFNSYYYHYSYPYYTNEYLLYNVIGLIGFYLAFIFYKKEKFKLKPIIGDKISNNKKLIFGIIVLYSALFMEIINIARVGGISIFSLGKEAYQTSIENLAFTLPANVVSYIGLAIFVLGIRNESVFKCKKQLIIFLIPLFAFFAIFMAVGSRGSLLAYIGIIALGFSSRKPVVKIKLKYLVILFLIYFSMIFVTVMRWQITNSISTGNYAPLIEKMFSIETYKSRLSLTDNEFVVGLGNFSEGYIEAKNHPRFGQTYLNGLVLPIPRFIYPFEKPKQILYEFRDKYFPERSTGEGSVGSTGYSTVLEAYLNFHSIGVFLQYFILGLLFKKLELEWEKNSNFKFNVFYLSFTPVLYTFSRNAFASIYNYTIYLILYIFAIIFIYNLLNHKYTIYIEKIIKAFKNPKLGILYFLSSKISRILPDSIYLKMKYRIIMNRKLNLKNSVTFNEKLQWLKLYDRKKEYINMVDKYKVRKYISSIIGDEYLISLLGVYESFDDINFDKLPNQFVLKPNHTSGDVFICKDKTKINFEELRKKVTKWLKRNYYWLHREWPYKCIERKIICEQYLEDKSDVDLKDYKFMCFNGKAKCMFVCLNRHQSNGLNVDFYDMDFHKMPFERHYHNSGTIIEKPKNWHKMIELSEKLSKDIPFVRVDFYEVNGQVYFGELTFFPGAGFEEFTPEKYDEMLGNWLKL